MKMEPYKLNYLEIPRTLGLLLAAEGFLHFPASKDILNPSVEGKFPVFFCEED